ncbi:hypothetical protein VTK73DRAFT_5238 [Phialemonium thermophilum]|uniref:Uncharacterized protein n=1 Tax=Phialemonium thermophilum TaxID=223376 RepID=A0ABR3V3M9_9PEZI
MAAESLDALPSVLPSVEMGEEIGPASPAQQAVRGRSGQQDGSPPATCLALDRFRLLVVPDARHPPGRVHPPQNTEALLLGDDHARSLRAPLPPGVDGSGDHVRLVPQTPAALHGLADRLARLRSRRVEVRVVVPLDQQLLRSDQRERDRHLPASCPRSWAIPPASGWW